MTEWISKGRDVETKLGKLSLRPNDLLLQLLPRHAVQIGMSVSVITNLPSINILQLPKLGKRHETSTLRQTRNIIESRSLNTVRAYKVRGNRPRPISTIIQRETNHSNRTASQSTWISVYLDHYR